MKAAVCYEFGKPLVVEEVDIDPPESGEVKVRVAACSICHSDVHLIRGDWGNAPPLIAGHEAAGVIEETGPGVSRVRPGDQVVVTLIRSCGTCYFCTIGRPFNCEASFPLQTESRLRNKDGVSLAHGIKTAAFAEFCIVDQSQVVKIPDDLSMECASLLACGVITGLGSVTNTARIESRSRVAVIGAGGVGLNAVQGAALSGASMIIAVDIRDDKLEAARAFGATHAVNAKTTDVIAEVKALTDGRGVDYAFATVGSPAAISQAIDMVHTGGTTVIVGMPSLNDALFSVDAHQITYGRRILGSNMGSTRLVVDVPRLVDLYREGRLKLDELISGRYPLERINEAIESMERGEALRNVIVFE